MIWNDKINSYSYYGSIEGESEINVTKYNIEPNVEWIFSGNFKGKFARYDNPDDSIEITDGRFDFNLKTVKTHPFP